DPSLPAIGARNGLAMLGFILPRLIPALLLAGLFQVVVPQEIVSRYFGREAGFKGLVMAMGAGVITPGGPMVSVPFLVALAHSGAGLPALVTYMTAWSLFGLQRIIAWEAPLMGWKFVWVRVNTFGSADRMATALGVERLNDLGARVAKLLDLKLPGSFLDKMRKLGSLLDVAKASPRHVRTAPCQEVVETANPSLAVLPIL